MTVLTEKSYREDFILWEIKQQYTRTQGTFHNGTGATADFERGQVLDTASSKYIKGVSTGATGILLKKLWQVPDNTDVLNVPVLVLGPCIVNQDALVFSGTSANQKAALIALGFKLISEPTKITTAT